jgi:hypothetical protein
MAVLTSLSCAPTTHSLEHNMTTSNVTAEAFADSTPKTSEYNRSLKLKARLFGVFFILTFLSYGIGSGMTASLTLVPDSLQQVFNNKEQLIMGVMLMAVFHTVFNISLAAIMHTVLKPFGKTVSFAYLSLAIGATVVLVIGGVLLLMQIPLADAFQINSSDASLVTLNEMLSYGAFVSYQMGMALWGIGGLLMSALLYRSGLVPKFFPIWGVIGYLIFIAGTVGEMFGFPYGVMLSMPGGLFEVTLSVWLIVKGFRVSQ